MAIYPPFELASFTAKPEELDIVTAHLKRDKAIESATWTVSAEA